MFLSKPASLSDPQGEVVRRHNKVSHITQSHGGHGPEGRIRKMFTKVELSVSSYDTAWIAMVPSPNSPREPCFPQCLNWLLKNQLPHGSWGLPSHHPLLVKDSLMSTLACLLALRKWENGEQYVRKGLEFIGSNFGAVMDKKQYSPIGFDIIFSGMVRYAKDLDLILPLDSSSVSAMLHKRDSEFKRVSTSNSKGKKAYLAYIAEGLVELQDWNNVIKYQRKNGSLFNSPSTTAATLMNFHDSNCFKYLNSLVERFGSAVPTIYPTDMYTSLCMVDRLEKLGISRHFTCEIKSVLDVTYRSWLQMDEEIVLDIETRALAFRLLRVNGYEVSSDALADLSEEEYFFDSLEGYLKSLNTILELYKASQIMASPNEPVLEKLYSWTSNFLKEQPSSGVIHDEKLHKAVDFSLRFPFDATVERLEHKRNIECYDVDHIRILKTSFRCSNIDNEEFLQLAVEDYNMCQAIYQKELNILERWIKENRLDQLKFARQKLTYLYFSSACILFPPELADARMSWTKNSVLTTVIDDFFDVGGCRNELENLIKLVDKWDENSVTDCCSEQVDIIFSALHKTINELEADAFTWQGRSVKSHLIDLWLTVLETMMKESDWAQNNSAPTMDEYMSIACITFGLGPVILTTLYFLGPKVSEENVRSIEFKNLVKHINIFGRLSNDIQGFQREAKEGKLNSVLLYMIHNGGTATEQEAVRAIKNVMGDSKRQLLKLVLQSEGSSIPKECKDLFWKANRVISLFYKSNDGFTSPEEMVSAVNAVIHDPLHLQFSSS